MPRPLGVAFLGATKTAGAALSTPRAAMSLSRAIQAVRHHAHQILTASQALCHATDEERFYRHWADLCRSLREFQQVYFARGYNGVTFPQGRRVPDVLSGFATVAEVEGVRAPSACEIAYMRGVSVRSAVRQASRRHPLADPVSVLDDQGEPVYTSQLLRELDLRKLGEYISPAAIPDALAAIAPWPRYSVDELRVGVVQEASRALLHVPRDETPLVVSSTTLAPCGGVSALTPPEGQGEGGDETAATLSDATTPDPQDDDSLPLADGPGAKRRFCWKGDSVTLSYLRYRLCAQLWDAPRGRPHEEVSIESVLKALHQDSADRNPKNLGNVIQHVNRLFEDKGWALRIDRLGDSIWLQAND